MTSDMTTMTYQATDNLHQAVWRAGAVAVIAGAAAAAAYARLLDLTGIPMFAGAPGVSRPERVGPANFAVGTAILTVIATIMAAVFARRSLRPDRTFVATTVGLTLVSLLLPLAAGATATSTKLTFALGHIVLAALIIPIIARRLHPFAVGAGTASPAVE
jgi:hypothetical protein